MRETLNEKRLRVAERQFVEMSRRLGRYALERGPRQLVEDVELAACLIQLLMTKMIHVDDARRKCAADKARATRKRGGNVF